MLYSSFDSNCWRQRDLCIFLVTALGERASKVVDISWFCQHCVISDLHRTDDFFVVKADALMFIYTFTPKLDDETFYNCYKCLATNTSYPILEAYHRLAFKALGKHKRLWKLWIHLEKVMDKAIFDSEWDSALYAENKQFHDLHL